MVIVLAVSGLVVAAFGALCGALAARFLNRRVLYAAWAGLIVIAAYLFIRGQTLAEYDRIESNVLVFFVLLPFLVGSVVTGLIVKRRA
ncbi:MAG: hypothetical protein JJ908_03665 [Rhizobiales bacterium]|nr:hypothetical protein [Hyphomicrobiales bacterium]MBO6698300.1 hypothetical protein [Hyphomicrobiales bacterium]MBO6735446.1 hypothetical protein [Hyphomicrobiales bacterium]MBO6910746.1 hypothetical protein [Hyphomicrobiales bacterium]MBO6956755.1 hypothetical protein [Hyphomicrobiales bacterium]